MRQRGKSINFQRRPTVPLLQRPFVFSHDNYQCLSSLFKRLQLSIGVTEAFYNSKGQAGEKPGRQRRGRNGSVH